MTRMSTCLAVVVALVAVLVPSAASEAATVSGTVVFDGPQAPPPTVDLTFYGYSFEYRTLAITGRQTAYRFDIADTAVNAADATFTSPVAPDAFWLQDAQDVAVRPQPGLALLGAGSYLADMIVFKQGVRYALPITDRAG